MEKYSFRISRIIPNMDRTSVKDSVLDCTSDGELEEILRDNSDNLVAIFFYTDRCPNCRRLKPHYHETHRMLKEEGITDIEGSGGGVIMLMVNSSRAGGHVKKLEVMGVPTVIFVHGGKMVYRFSGVTDYERLSRKIRALVEELHIGQA